MNSIDTFSGPYDFLVIGGGINGAAIANVASRQGMKVALVEKGDFASGTSSKSSKLIHGGLRYLENFEFGLVREALHERLIQLNAAPHLVKPLSFLIPVYREDPRSLWMMKAGVWLYDALSGRYRVGRHQALSAEDILSRIPGIKREGLIGGVEYFDAQTDDARLCLENVLAARAAGAHAANYTEVTGFVKESGRAVGVKARDVLQNRNFEIRAGKIVCAVGPWTPGVWGMDSPGGGQKVRTTKGAHIICRRKVSDSALFVQTRDNGRIFFIIPWMGRSLIGTTDTDYHGDPDQVAVAEDDIEYLLKETNRLFPETPFGRTDVVGSFAGLRPLAYRAGAPSRVSRRHAFEESPSGIVFVTGGKYTTYRRIALACVALVAGRRTGPDSDDYAVYGGGKITESPLEAARKYGIDRETIEHVMGKYGTRYAAVLDLTREAPELKNRICSCHEHIGAQVLYSIRVEMARSPKDILFRRLGVGYDGCGEIEKYRQVIDQYLSS
ncbi:MAG: glycerol-3-phosphate dehydrogenase/oxidase [Candidatus Omnitrophota bacterium]|nr:glycerol-3-phosphate dehydrogenase/oxidase [Candidatus Omnitrophota bacterium]MDZ4242023.1 glycerol-3-phosphate dehydrogenase/oxidase [Candidatus Omnitrophota bacterium]